MLFLILNVIFYNPVIYYPRYVRKMVGHEDERTTLNSYCFNRKSKDQTRTDLEQTLVIAENRQFKAKTKGGATIIPFKQKDTEKLQNGVSKGNQK